MLNILPRAALIAELMHVYAAFVGLFLKGSRTQSWSRASIFRRGLASITQTFSGFKFIISSLPPLSLMAPHMRAYIVPIRLCAFSKARSPVIGANIHTHIYVYFFICHKNGLHRRPILDKRQQPFFWPPLWLFFSIIFHFPQRGLFVWLLFNHENFHEFSRLNF